MWCWPGLQTGNKEDYEDLKKISDEGTIIIDDANPQELLRFITEKKADILIGGVKERPIAYKIGIGFCDHNHERKTALAGYEGMLNFAEGSLFVRNEPGMEICAEKRRLRREKRQAMKTQDAPVSVTNACKLCSPLGAVLAFRGIEGAVCILHGSQGCATYIRRYMISHYKEPLDVASSSFSEDAAVFGGAASLHCRGSTT